MWSELDMTVKLTVVYKVPDFLVCNLFHATEFSAKH